uniref:ATP synthase epsilon chain, chloroplastic n=1 Tax=Eutreptia sp. CCAC 1914B TaxID=2979827 RepID=A0A977K9F9_9EUGL|nr:ATP synthase CF1 epsilon subunit [Eutreptia sp. CCAC 1914B]
MLVPDRVFWKDQATEIILPTLNGQIGVLTNHIPVLTGLDIGTVLIRTSASSDWLVICVMGGFALVKNNQVTVLVNEAEFASDIDATSAEALFLEAKTNLEKASEGKQKIDANLQFKKAKARLQVVNQNK